MTATCENCAFWRQDDPPKSRERTRALFGECRRSAPRLKFDRYDGDTTSSVWPPTSQGDWCGEFRPTDMQLPLEERAP